MTVEIQTEKPRADDGYHWKDEEKTADSFKVMIDLYVKRDPPHPKVQDYEMVAVHNGDISEAEIESAKQDPAFRIQMWCQYNARVDAYIVTRASEPGMEAAYVRAMKTDLDTNAYYSAYDNGLEVRRWYRPNPGLRWIVMTMLPKRHDDKPEDVVAYYDTVCEYDQMPLEVGAERLLSEDHASLLAEYTQELTAVSVSSSGAHPSAIE